jgi:long-subunit acyl-CoA synthetase (AMP-forming)
MADAVTEYFPSESSDTFVSYLPSAHAADRFFTHYFGMVRGFETITLDDARALVSVLPEVRPTLFAAVPRIWEKLRVGVELQLEAVEAFKQAFDAGDPGIAAAIREKLGLDRVKWALSGAAAIAPDDFGFLQRLGIPVAEIWGMSECGMGTGSSPADARQGTVGKAPSAVELRLAEDGELLLRGPSVMKGYRNDPAQTAAAIDVEGWLHSGDIATVDDDGYVRIIDRKKELIINSAGKNMSPSNIEHSISTSSMLIGNVVAIGDARPYNVALITLDPDAAAMFAASNGIDASPDILTKDERVLAAVQQGVDAGNAKLARVEQVKRFVLLPTYWEPGGDELTPTSKLKRRPISAKYADQIEELYA